MAVRGLLQKQGSRKPAEGTRPPGPLRVTWAGPRQGGRMLPLSARNHRARLNPWASSRTQSPGTRQDIWTQTGSSSPPPATWGHPLVAFGQTRKGRHAGPGGCGRDEGPNPTEPYRPSCAGPLVCPGARWSGKGTRQRGPRAGDVTRKLDLKGKSPEPREDRRKRSAPVIQSPVARNADRRWVLLFREPCRALWFF